MVSQWDPDRLIIEDLSNGFSSFALRLHTAFSHRSCCGFVDSITGGGGGLISLPVLLSLGMPPQLTLGTNKLQGSSGTLSSAATFIRKGAAIFRTMVFLTIVRLIYINYF